MRTYAADAEVVVTDARRAPVKLAPDVAGGSYAVFVVRIYGRSAKIEVLCEGPRGPLSDEGSFRFVIKPLFKL